MKNGWNEVIRFILGHQYIQHSKIVTVIVLGVLLVQSILNSRKQGIILFASSLWYWFVLTVIWAVVLNQRAAILFVFLVFYAWCSKYDKNTCNNKIVQQLTVILIMQANEADCFLMVKNH